MATVGTNIPADRAVLADVAGVEQWETAIAKQINTTAKTSAYTLANTDGIILLDPSGGAWNLTLGAASSYSPGFEAVLINTKSSANQVTLVPNGTDNINGANSNLACFGSSTQWKRILVTCDGASNWYVSPAGF